MKQLAAILSVLCAAAGLAVAAEPVPLPRPRPPVWAPPPWAAPSWAEPHSFRDAAGPDFNSAEVTAQPSDCNIRLEKIAVLAPMPRLIGPGACGGGDMVRLDAVLVAPARRVELKPAPYLRCPMAEQLAAWVREDAAPRVAATGVALRSVETYDDFDCRGRNRKLNGKISEHGKGNAIDLRGLTFEDGRFAGLTDMTVAKELRLALRDSACARFGTVLGPGSDGHHEAHVHLDLIERRNGYRICQWDVREPPPLPPPKPGADETKPEAEAATDPAAAGTQFAGPAPLPQPRPAVPAQRSRPRRL